MQAEDLQPDEAGELSDEQRSLLNAIARLVCECVNNWEGSVAFGVSSPKLGNYTVTVQADSPLRTPAFQTPEEAAAECWLRRN